MNRIYSFQIILLMKIPLITSCFKQGNFCWAMDEKKDWKEDNSHWSAFSTVCILTIWNIPWRIDKEDNCNWFIKSISFKNALSSSEFPWNLSTFHSMLSYEYTIVLNLFFAIWKIQIYLNCWILIVFHELTDICVQINIISVQTQFDIVDIGIDVIII